MKTQTKLPAQAQDRIVTEDEAKKLYFMHEDAFCRAEQASFYNPSGANNTKYNQVEQLGVDAKITGSPNRTMMKSEWKKFVKALANF